MGWKKFWHLELFNLIAPFYQWFFKSQVKSYRNRLNVNLPHLFLPSNATILDIGCGTGAFGKVFQDLGYDVVGVDDAPNMVKWARKNSIKAEIQNVLTGLHFPDQSFDLVIIANVAHGFSALDRNHLYREALRVSKGRVLFHDFNPTRRFITTLIEWFERGHYFEFIKQVPEDFFEVFDHVHILDFTGESSWYLCYGER